MVCCECGRPMHLCVCAEQKKPKPKQRLKAELEGVTEWHDQAPADNRELEVME